MKILITGGGSEEPIDNVRYISNFSTGKTAAYLAETLYKAGHDVTLLTAIKSAKPESYTEDCECNCNGKGRLSVITYRTFNDLKENLERECTSSRYDGIIHAAAVSDYSVSKLIIGDEEYEPGSIPKVSSGLELTIKLKKNPKLVDMIKSWVNANKASGANTKLVAFKLTSKATEEERKTAVKKVFDSTGDEKLAPDFVVSNDLSEITKTEHPCVIWQKGMTIARKVQNLEGLATALSELLN